MNEILEKMTQDYYVLYSIPSNTISAIKEWLGIQVLELGMYAIHTPITNNCVQTNCRFASAGISSGDYISQNEEQGMFK